MLVSHVVPTSMKWQSRLFNDFDYLDAKSDNYINDSNTLNRIILVKENIKHNLKGPNVFQLVKGVKPAETISLASITTNPVLLLTADAVESWNAYKATSYQDIAIDFTCFTKFKRGNNLAEQQMFARFSFISSIKREIIDSQKRIWLIGLTQPHEIKRYGNEIYAVLNDVVVKEAFWRTKLSNSYYTSLHSDFPDTEIVPLGVYESVRLFNSWVH